MEAEETAPEAAAFHGGAGGLSTARKVVPWSSWGQWLLVRDGLFSPRPAAALRRIAAWRSRGCLPIPVDITAAFVEIRQKDPFFRSSLSGDDALESEEMLAMLYSMAIMRLVNGFVENPHKKTGRSISELAEAVGIPRVLVDIRHESSHRNLPSLRLLRLAAIKAFDWLRCIYWDPQTAAIPDAQVEMRSRLCEIARLLKATDSKKSSFGSKRKRSEKLISKAIKYVVRLYYACPSEVLSVLLDFFQLDTPESFHRSDMQQTDNLDVSHSSDVQISDSDMKTVITKLSQKEPRLLLGMLKSVIEMTETGEAMEYKGRLYAFQSPAEPSKMKNLCSLVLWLVTNIKDLKDSGCIGLVHEIGVLSSDRNAISRFCLAKLLQRCLSLSILGERYLIDAALLLIEMIDNNNVKEKLRKLPILSLASGSAEDSALPESEIMPREELTSVEKATENLEMFKLQLKKQKSTALGDNNTEGTLGTMSYSEKSNRWVVTKSWIPCPIGMIPCSFSSTAVLPVLDVIEPKDSRPEQEGNFEPDDHTEIFDSYSHPEEQMDDERVPKRLRPSPEYEISNVPGLTSPLQGRLLVGGVWKKVTKEELLFIKSKMKVLL